MALEGTGGGELAQLVADHLLGNIVRHVLATVVNGDRVADKVRKMVEERLQVFRMRFSPALFISWTRFSSTGCTKGPFLMLLPIILDLLSLTCCYGASR